MSIAHLGIASPDEDRRGTDYERTPPYDLLAEQSALGGMLLSKDAVADVTGVLKGHDFYVPKHEVIYEAVLSLYSQGEPTDVITVTDALSKSGDLQRAGGAEYLHTLTSIVPTAANAGFYADIVGEGAAAQARRGRHAHRADGVRGRGRGARSREHRAVRDLRRDR